MSIGLMLDPHALAKRVYPPRTFGFLLAVLLMILLHGWQVLIDPTKAPLLFSCLLYPHVAFFTQQRWNHSAHLVRMSMVLDSLLVGLLIVASHFYLLAIVSFVSFLVVSTAIISRLEMILLMLGVVFITAFAGSHFDSTWLIEVHIFVQIGFALALITYPTYIAWSVFGVTREMTISSRVAESRHQSLQQTTDHLRRYISPQLFSALAERPEAGETKRRRLTLCFTDLSGFTELMDRLPEQEITEVLNEYLNAMAIIAIEHGGTVDKFIGDGLMIFFGDPKSLGHQEDAIACTKMALAMRTKLAQLSAGWADRGLSSALQLRIGIHTGYCAVGNFGSDNRMDYTAIGGAVNIASRLEAAAPEGEILVSAETLQLLHGNFEVKHYPSLKLKGIRDPVTCALIVSAAVPSVDTISHSDLSGVTLEVDLETADLVALRRLLLLTLKQLKQRARGQKPAQSVMKLLR